MKKAIVNLVMVLVIISSVACQNGTAGQEGQNKLDQTTSNQQSIIDKTTVTVDTKTSQASNLKMRTIVDLSGHQVDLPPAEAINRVVIISPPLLATYLNVTGKGENIVGLHPGCLKNMHSILVDKVLPNHKGINTRFVKGYASNSEELLSLKPDVILAYGDFQKKGLENIDIPVVDFFLKNMQNEAWSVAVDNLMREIFEKASDNTLQLEWDKANKIVDAVLKDMPENQRKTAIMMRENSTDALVVRGNQSYGDDWLKITGLKNLAVSLEGENAIVNMEQIYDWNPDIIYCFTGADADVYYQNDIVGRDFSLIKAYRNKAIYDTPNGMFNWGAPCVDSPLMRIWMTMKNYPGTIEETFFRQYMTDYYQRNYNITLSDEMIDKILDPDRK